MADIVEKRGFRLGLTTRLALVGAASALLPFLVCGLLLVVLPDRIGARQVDSELDHAASLAAARLQSSRADLAFALAGVDRATLERLALAGDEPAIAAAVRESWSTVTGNDGSELDVQLRADRRQSAGDGAVAAYLLLRAGDRRIDILAREPRADARILRETSRATDVQLALASTTSRRATPGDERSALVSIDADRRLGVRASVSGSPIALLLRSRGGELQAALLMLLAAGVLGGIAVALIMNRFLSRFARTAERMSGGDFEIRLPVIGSDAGARVAGSLNDLASELQARIGALEHSIEQLDRTLEGIEDGVCAWSPDGELETWNAGAAQLTMVDASTARAGSPATDMLATEHAPGRRRVLLPVGDGSRSVAVEMFVRRMADGGVLQVFRDATPALSIEQARKNFLVTAAHELRTPLTSILGFAATLADDSLELTPEVRRLALNQILDEAERLDTVVDSLFESSLLARDKLAVSIGRVEVRTVLREAMQVVGVLDVDFDGVEAVSDVRADRRALVRVIGSLLDNAVKYGDGPVLVRASYASNRVRIEVRDHGPGIPEESHEAVFEPFFRIDPDMRNEVGGAGMGLYTARRLVEAMGGSLVLANDGDGTGALLTIVLAAWTESPGRDAGSAPQAARTA